MSESNGDSWIERDLASNRRYFESAGAEGTPASWINEDLTHHDLTGATLVESTLIDSDFSGCKLAGADLARAFAGGAKFVGAAVDGANFAKATLVGADFSRATAVGAQFTKAKLTDAALAAADLTEATLISASARGASFRDAVLISTDLTRTVLSNADLTGADLTGARFEATIVDKIRLDGVLGLDRAEVVSIVVGLETLVGRDARAWLLTRAGVSPGAPERAAWTVREFQLFLLSKMSSVRRVAEAVRHLEATPAELERVSAELGLVFDRPGLRAEDFRRLLGRPVTRGRVDTTTTAFAGSWREEYALSLWPDVTFVVNEDPRGVAWGWGFEGGWDQVPDDLAKIEPWRWSSERLRGIAVETRVVDEWTHDLEVVLTFDAGAGRRAFLARFQLGLLQEWTPTPGDPGERGA